MLFERRKMGRKLGTKRHEVLEGWRKYVLRNFMICTLPVL
jgi:hypothetical protein